MNEKIRQILAQHSALQAALDALGDGDDLYAAGMSSHGSVQLMLALEEAFDIEFPDSLLNRKSFSSISVIQQTVSQLACVKEAA